jgi:hypothetical protein
MLGISVAGTILFTPLCIMLHVYDKLRFIKRGFVSMVLTEVAKNTFSLIIT